MGVFDQGARYLVRKRLQAFLACHQPQFLARFTFHRFLDTALPTFPGEPDRICDLITEFIDPNDATNRRILDIEVQTEPHPDMMERLGEYAYRLRREVRFGEGQEGKYPVISFLVGLTGPPQPDESNLTEPDLNDAGIRQKILVWTLREDSAAETVARVAAGAWDSALLPLVPLMQGGGDLGIITEWKRLVEREADRHWRADLVGLALVFAELTPHLPVWRQALEGFDVRQSQQVLEWQAQARVEEKQKCILRALRVRLRVEVPTDLEQALAEIMDQLELERWLDASLTAVSLDEFRSTIGR